MEKKELFEKIERTKKNKWETLDLSLEGLTEIPKEIGQLSSLRELDLSGNQITLVPESLGQLSNLRKLELDNNQLTLVPESLGQLSNLQALYLHNNQLTSVPNSLGQLSNLRWLSLSSNQLKSVPYTLGKLRNLKKLWLSHNQIKSIPDSLGQLSNLQRLYISGNPLESPPADVVERGLGAILEYLRELGKGAMRRFEAKLLILGYGGEGKTCVSRALRELTFEKQERTGGVEVVPWRFENPKFPADRSKNVTLHVWDFEGQEINHQSHQFFLSEKSLYLLVMKGRGEFRMERVEYWLDTIRARAPGSRVILVASECENTTPSWPLDKLKENYSDLLKKGNKCFFEVGCESGKGISELAAEIKDAAAEVLGEGINWPVTYTRAVETVSGLAQQKAQVSRAGLYEIFKASGISEDGFESAAAQMHSLGLITQFKDSPALEDFVVLDPQWLTKGISKVMEDKQLEDDKGEISHKRMKAIWDDGYNGLYPVLHNCMKEFELCYDMEDEEGCLIPLRFGDAIPEIPWSDIPNAKERRIEYQLNIRPPYGIMSRFIVRTHHMIVKTPDVPKGVYWHNGVFLSSGEGEYRSEALCEFEQEKRRLQIKVRAAFPQNMAEQLHGFAKAVFGFFEGLVPERNYGCIKFMDDKEKECAGTHPEMLILYALSKNREITCEKGWHDVDAKQLVYGFSSFGETVFTVEELKKELSEQPKWAKPFIEDVKTSLVWIDKTYNETIAIRRQCEKLPAKVAQEVQMRLRDYLGMFNEMLDGRDFNSAPAVVAIRPIDRSAFNPNNWFEKEYEIMPYCECEDGVHPVDFSVKFKKPREWWEKMAMTVTTGMKVLSAGLKIACAGLPLAVDAKFFEAMQKETEFMKELADHLELEGGAESDISEKTGEFAKEYGQGGRVKDFRQLGGENGKRIARMQLARLLEEIAPKEYTAKQWGELRRVRMPDNTHRWLCQDHIKKRR